MLWSHFFSIRGLLGLIKRHRIISSVYVPQLHINVSAVHEAREKINKRKKNFLADGIVTSGRRVFSNDYREIKTVLPTPPSLVRQSALIRQLYALLCEFFLNNFLKKIRIPWTPHRHNNTMMRDIRVCEKRLDHGTNVFLAAAYWDFCNFFFFFLKKRYVRVHCRPAGVTVSSIDETHTNCVPMS